MLTSPTLDKLNQLRLKGMARALLEQREGSEYHSLSFEERLGLLVDREAQDRENRRLARYLGKAKLRPTPALRTSTSAILGDLTDLSSSCAAISERNSWPI